MTPRFSFEPARSAGDKLLDAADGLKIEVHHCPEFDPPLSCRVELRSSLPMHDGQAGFALLAELLDKFQQKGGQADAC